MLFVLFQAGPSHFAIPATDVLRIIPSVPLAPLPQSPPHIRGLLPHLNDFIPVIDLCSLLLGRPAASQLSTRLLLVHFQTRSNHLRQIGLIAENVTEAADLNPASFTQPPVQADNHRFLGELALADGRLIQALHIEHLLPDSFQQILYPPAPAA